jgi:hypothetical protein
MFSNKLTHLIETHWDDIAAETIQRIRNDEEVPHMQKLSDPDLLNWAREILVALKSGTLASEDERLAIQYNELGRVRFENSVPLYEVVRCLHILKSRVSGFVRDHAFAQNALELYGQEELEHNIGLFFDWLLYTIARGYEDARQRAAAPRY